MRKKMVHPYIPNSVPEVKQSMLVAVGAKEVLEFFADIPENLRLNRALNLPEPLVSEFALKRHIEGLLSRNISCEEYLNFLGAGCYQHYVPAICDEVNQRGEFLTAYAGEPYDDHGRFQALFEYTSMMAELLNMEVVNVPTYDGFQAAATALRMAARVTGRQSVIIPNWVGADKLSKISGYLKPDIEIRRVVQDVQTGQIDLKALEQMLTPQTAAVFFENPGYLGMLEESGLEISQLTHEKGAVCVVSVDPSSLGILSPPADYGADIVCGDIQPLGMHMNYGGGHAGFIATHDIEEYVMQFPSRLFGISPTIVEGEYGFGDVAYERTSFARREEGNEWVGTASALWGITAGVYLALMGPQGMVELGEGILARCAYAIKRISQIPGVIAPVFKADHYKEFVVDFNNTGKTVEDINRFLLDYSIFGGKDLSYEFPEFGQSALYCVNEIHSKADIDRLANQLEEAIKE